MKRTSTPPLAPSRRGARPVLVRTGVLVGALAGLVTTTLACERAADADPQVTAEARSTPSQVPAVADVAAGTGEAQQKAQSSYHEEAFALSLQAPGAAEVGSPAHAEVILEAKAPYKVNQEYPIKLALSESAGLAVAASTVGKEATSLEPSKAVMKVAFTPKAAGEHELSGRLSFSVCTDERCLIEKRDLSVQVVVR